MKTLRRTVVTATCLLVVFGAVSQAQSLMPKRLGQEELDSSYASAFLCCNPFSLAFGGFCSGVTDNCVVARVAFPSTGVTCAPAGAACRFAPSGLPSGTLNAACLLSVSPWACCRLISRAFCSVFMRGTCTTTTITPIAGGPSLNSCDCVPVAPVVPRRTNDTRFICNVPASTICIGM